MSEHLNKILHHLTGLVRTRVVICGVGLIVMYNKPIISQSVVALCGLAIGVSAVDAWKGDTRGRPIARDDN